MTVDPAGTMNLVESDVEKILAVVRPGSSTIGKKLTGRIGNRFMVKVASDEILNENGELLRPVEVYRVRQLHFIRANCKRSHPAEFLTFGERVLVEQNFFRCVQGSTPAAEDAVLAAGLHA